MSDRQRYTTGWDSEERFAYSRAVRVGDTIYVSGTTGFDYEADRLDPDPAVQTDKAIDNIGAALEAVGGRLDDIVHLTTHVSDLSDWREIGPVFKRRFDEIRPAHTAVEAKLISPAMKIEITAIAVTSPQRHAD